VLTPVVSHSSGHTSYLRVLVGAERRGGVRHSSGERVVVRVDGAADGAEVIPPGAARPLSVDAVCKPV
jgi:hypothetical protein